MEPTPVAIRLSGLSKIDQLEISEVAGEEAARFETGTPEDSKVGFEPVTVGVITLTALGIKALSAWLLKHRQHNRIERTVELEYPDGTKRTETLVVDLKSSSPPDEQVLKALADLTKVSLPAVDSPRG